ncbi:MAG: type III-A CRISPR-associated protein Csm2 [Acetobacteraceae bacterium]|nr:type III-A CRISPR-associated protein Csm2 [Acetobacteraceae bacterium]
MKSQPPGRGPGAPGAGMRMGGREAGKPPPALPADYLKQGYLEVRGDKCYERRELIVEGAAQVADALSQAKMTTASLRRFFHQVRAIQHRLEASAQGGGGEGRDFRQAQADLDRLLPLVAYAEGRGVVPRPFRRFLEENVKLARRDERHFTAFVRHFESVVAFMKERERR